MPLQTYRYAACGGANTLFSIFLYWFGLHFIFDQQNVFIRFPFIHKMIVISPHIAADYLFAMWIAFPTGFYLSRYVIFEGSELKGHVQLFRYFLVILGCIFVNYFFLKLFVNYLGFYPTPSKILTTFFVVVFNYISQTYFSFKVRQGRV